jgi:hypothetical protein
MTSWTCLACVCLRDSFDFDAVLFRYPLEPICDMLVAPIVVTLPCRTACDANTLRPDRLAVASSTRLTLIFPVQPTQGRRQTVPQNALGPKNDTFSAFVMSLILRRVFPLEGCSGDMLCQPFPAFSQANAECAVSALAMTPVTSSPIQHHIHY